MLNLKHFKGLRITSKFILWFLVIALVPLAIAIQMSYSGSRKALREEVTKSLFAVAENKAKQVEAYFREKEKNTAALSSLSDIVDIIQKFSDGFDNGGVVSSEYISADQQYRPFLTYYQKSLGFDDLILIRQDGDIIFSVKEIENRKSLYEATLLRESPLSKIFIRTIKSSKAEISDFTYDPKEKKAVLFISVPIFEGQEFKAVIILQLTNEGVSELVKDYTGLGETGEIILASELDREIALIAPLRFDPDAAFKKKIAIESEEGSRINEAISGEKGLGVYSDYREKEVLAVWRDIPAFHLGMVVKMDTAEIMSSAERLRNNLFIIGLALLVAVVIAAVIIARTISNPIKELTAVSSVISGGDLSARAPVKGRDEIGELARSFNHMTDSLVDAKARVEEQKRLLQEANKELDSFVYTVSHDLKAPLRGIEAFTGFIKEDYADKVDKQGRDYLDRICGGVKRMREFIDDLLTLSRISRIKNPHEDVDMGELIKSVIERIEFDIKAHKVELKVAERLPVVHCDRIKMAEVFLNLINNAVKFSSKNNKENPRVEVGYNDTETMHEFYVKDNGIGIDKKYHNEIFGMFKRLHKQEEYEGTGAGLGIVKRIIEDHKGSIWVDSEIGKGAAFYFTISKALKEKERTGA